MKRKMCSLILAIVTFIAAYMIMSFAIPGFRIKLEAAPAVVFVETLKIDVYKRQVSLRPGVGSKQTPTLSAVRSMPGRISPEQ